MRQVSRPLFLALSVVAGSCVLTVDAADAPSPFGEPYALTGNKIVFTTWHFIRPGSFAWINAKGQNVTVAGSENASGAHLEKRDHPTGIRIVVQPAQRSGPIVQSEKPWETHGVSLSTIIADENKFRAWGYCADAKNDRFTCYLESTDGKNWTRPELRLCDFTGTKNNNLLPLPFGGTVFKDPHAPASERYKWVNLDSIDNKTFETYRAKYPHDWHPAAIRRDVGKTFAVIGAVSPDGLHWTRLEQPLVVEHSDTQLVAYYDERRGKYVLFTRNYSVGHPTAGYESENRAWWGGDAPGIGRRAIGRTESADFRHFPISKVVLEPGPDDLPDDTLYTNCRTTIPGTGEPLLFPAIWHTSNDTTSIAIAASDDDRNWHFLTHEPIVDTAAYGEWDGGCVFAHPNLLELPDGALALPYTGYNFRHKYPRGQLRFQTGYALWPKARLIGLEAPDHGEFATAIILAPGAKLRLNLKTKPTGKILVEAADRDGHPLPGCSFADAIPLTGDDDAAEVKWKNQTAPFKKGAPIMLRFRMDQSTLFAITFE